MSAGSLPPSVVRFTRGGGIVGLGVLVGGREIVTCAHVVNLSLGRDKLDAERPERVEVQVGERTFEARVEQWVPPPAREGAPGDDVAGLRLDDPAPVEPARLITTLPGIGQEVRIFGYPGKPVRPNGSWVTAVVRGEVDGGLVQLDSASAIQVQPGYSGSPVWDVASGRVIGIVATAGRNAADSYAVGADRLRQVWPEVLDRRRRWHVENGLEHLTVLQPAGPRFGGEPPVDGLFDDVADVRPDLVVVAGDLTAHGLRTEFEQAFAWLDGLAEAVELPRDRVVVVPGTHDVNRKACQAYFLRMEAEEREPLPPYWAKWEQYAEAFQRFYRDVPVAFTADEPWSLFAVPELAVAVAGFNSTMADSHLGDARPEFGDEQVTRLSRGLDEYRDRGWFRIGVADRWAVPRLGLPRHSLHVTLDGSLAAGSYEVMRIDSTGVDRRTRLVAEDRWVRHDRTDMFWSSAEKTFGNAEGQRRRTEVRHADGFFERVLDATKVDRPGATVTPNRENSYLRVTERRPGGGVEQWPVFVTEGAVTREVLDGFRDIHLRFAEQDPQTRSELVHGGPPAPADVVAHALSLGIRVRSWIDYQGLVDLRALEERQRRALAEDVVYPPELYVPQRYRELGRLRAGEEQVDLLDRVVRWLSADSARFVMVLGDFGRGKSFLLRQLARVLPARLRGLTPVLIELRSLEKAPSLDTLLVQHLSRAGVEEISAPKLKYMIDSGRVALLFDGFDELELRVGYDNATDYLRVLLQRVDDRAKVVLTSRTQHFRLTSDVLNVLGEQVTSMTSSRVALLEDFTDEQILDFLTRHYRGDADRARARFALLGDVRDLLGLSRNPRMLSFIADLDEQRLREVERQEGRISAAELYRELVDHWLVKETDRQRHRSGLPSLTERERLDVCTTLALRLWATTASAIRESDLGAAAETLALLTEGGYSLAQAQHAVGSGTLLVHTDDGFGFVHQSVMEWLVANAAAQRMDAVADIANRVMSPLMVDFFCDLAGHDAARAWARGVPGDAAEAVKQNASAVLARLGGPERTELSGMDLRGHDLARFDLREAKLGWSDLRGQRWTDLQLTGADLTGANLTGVRVTGGDLTGAALTGTTWRRAALIGVRGGGGPARTGGRGGGRAGPGGGRDGGVRRGGGGRVLARGGPARGDPRVGGGTGRRGHVEGAASAARPHRLGPGRGLLPRRHPRGHGVRGRHGPGPPGHRGARGHDDRAHRAGVGGGAVPGRPGPRDGGRRPHDPHVVRRPAVRHLGRAHRAGLGGRLRARRGPSRHGLGRRHGDHVDARGQRRRQDHHLAGPGAGRGLLAALDPPGHGRRGRHRTPVDGPRPVRRHVPRSHRAVVGRRLLPGRRLGGHRVGRRHRPPVGPRRDPARGVRGAHRTGPGRRVPARRQPLDHHVHRRHGAQLEHRRGDAGLGGARPRGTGAVRDLLPGRHAVGDRVPRPSAHLDHDRRLLPRRPGRPGDPTRLLAERLGTRRSLQERHGAHLVDGR